MQSIKRVALSSPESSYPDGKSRYVVSQMFTQFGGHSGEVKLYEYQREVSPSVPVYIRGSVRVETERKSS
jgi:hypothetical protein